MVRDYTMDDDVMMISRIQIAVVGSYLLLSGFNFGFLVFRNQIIKNFKV